MSTMGYGAARFLRRRKSDITQDSDEPTDHLLYLLVRMTLIKNDSHKVVRRLDSGRCWRAGLNNQLFPNLFRLYYFLTSSRWSSATSSCSSSALRCSSSARRCSMSTFRCCKKVCSSFICASCCSITARCRSLSVRCRLVVSIMFSSPLIFEPHLNSDCYIVAHSATFEWCKATDKSA